MTAPLASPLATPLAATSTPPLASPLGTPLATRLAVGGKLDGRSTIGDSHGLVENGLGDRHGDDLALRRRHRCKGHRGIMDGIGTGGPSAPAAAASASTLCRLRLRRLGSLL